MKITYSNDTNDKFNEIDEAMESANASWKPNPIDLSNVELDNDLENLTERVAEWTHEAWAARKLEDGWIWGPGFDSLTKTAPLLVPYGMLPEDEKESEKRLAADILRLIIKEGYRIEKT